MAKKEKEGIVLYSSKTGYTKRYAEYLAEQLGYDIKPLHKANLFNVSCYPTVIYGGGLHHNRIDGIQGVVEGFKYFGEQNVVLFSVGLSSLNDELLRQIRSKNLPDYMDDAYSFFALPGGLALKDTQAGGAMAEKVALYREKRAQGKKLTRGDKLALAIADGETAPQDRFDPAACAPIIQAARRRL
jgi:hypothetical protein